MPITMPIDQQRNQKEWLSGLKQRYAVLKDCTDVRITDVPGIADRYVIDIFYPDNKRRTFTANDQKGIEDALAKLSEEAS